jgi:hypothetical protein
MRKARISLFPQIPQLLARHVTDLNKGLLTTRLKESTGTTDLNCVEKWYDRYVFNTDGTYFQMQDSPGIPEKYRVQKDSEGKTQGYPQGLLQVLTQRSGCTG